MIDLTIDQDALARNVEHARKNGVVIPTFKQMKNPETLPHALRDRLEDTGLADIDPLNLFRITWKNEPKERGGQFGDVNCIELPPELTGVAARILCLAGKWFPTGSHKVGAAFGCLVPKLVTGRFDAAAHKAVWPSMGNFCRGGAFASKLLSVDSIAVLPEGMDRERFRWFERVAGEIVATPGTERNATDILNKISELRATRDDVAVFDQFDEMGNHLWHYEVTGDAVAETFERLRGARGNLAAVCLASGSFGTLGCGDFLKERYPAVKLAVGEALQCPTLLNNGHGKHRIEGVGGGHVPWIHNARNTDLVIAVDDEDCVRIFRLFNEPEGRRFLGEEAGVGPDMVEQLGLFGISGIAGLLCAVKTAKYYELTGDDIIVTVLADSADMYGPRLREFAETEGPYTPARAAVDFGRHLLGVRPDAMEELAHKGRKRIHDLKYHTWVEQRGKTVDELDALWYDPDTTWGSVHRSARHIDELIEEFNEQVGLA